MMTSTELVPQGAVPRGMISPEMARDSENGRMFVTVFLDRHLFGLPVDTVREIIYPSRIHMVPLSLPQVAGLVNIRGRIIPVIDLHCHLGIEKTRVGDEKPLGIVIERGEFMDCLLVDAIGDIVTFQSTAAQSVPKTVSAQWRKTCSSVYRLGERLMLVLDPEVLLEGIDAEVGKQIFLPGEH